MLKCWDVYYIIYACSLSYIIRKKGLRDFCAKELMRRVSKPGISRFPSLNVLLIFLNFLTLKIFNTEGILLNLILLKVILILSVLSHVLLTTTALFYLSGKSVLSLLFIIIFLFYVFN